MCHCRSEDNLCTWYTKQKHAQFFSHLFHCACVRNNVSCANDRGSSQLFFINPFFFPFFFLAFLWHDCQPTAHRGREQLIYRHSQIIKESLIVKPRRRQSRFLSLDIRRKEEGEVETKELRNSCWLGQQGNYTNCNKIRFRFNGLLLNLLFKVFFSFFQAVSVKYFITDI